MPSGLRRKKPPGKKKGKITLPKIKAAKDEIRMPEWADQFLEHLSRFNLVSMACKRAGISRSSVYDARDRCPEFAKRWEDALEESVDVVEMALRKKALSGNVKAQIKYLRSRRPEIYGKHAATQIAIEDKIIIDLTRDEDEGNTRDTAAKAHLALLASFFMGHCDFPVG